MAALIAVVLLIGPVFAFAGAAYACARDVVPLTGHETHRIDPAHGIQTSQIDRDDTTPLDRHGERAPHDHALCGVSQPSLGILTMATIQDVDHRSGPYDRLDDAEPHRLSLPAPTEPPRA